MSKNRQARINKNIIPGRISKHGDAPVLPEHDTCTTRSLPQESHVYVPLITSYEYENPLMRQLNTPLEEKAATRLATFQNGTKLYYEPEAYADNGFYLTDRADWLRCFSCKISLKHWGDADPLLEHVRFSPSCTYMRSKIGDEVMDHLIANYSHLPRWAIKERFHDTFISVTFADEEHRKTSLAGWSGKYSPEIISNIVKYGFYRSDNELENYITCAYCNIKLHITPSINIQTIKDHHIEGCPMLMM